MGVSVAWPVNGQMDECRGVFFSCVHRKTIWYHCHIIPGMACFSRVVLCVLSVSYQYPVLLSLCFIFFFFRFEDWGATLLIPLGNSLFCLLNKCFCWFRVERSFYPRRNMSPSFRYYIIAYRSFFFRLVTFAT